MVQRTSDPFELSKATGGTEATGIRLGAGRLREAEDTTPSIGEQALFGLVNKFGEVAADKFDASVQMKYMEGQRARMAGQAQESVDSNIFSAPFVNGGYQDQDYRIAQAEMAQEMDTFIKTTGRSMSPSAFRAVVQERAGKFTDRFEGLSQRGQMSALANQQKMEEGLFTKQASTYAQWSIDQGTKAYLTQGNQIINDLARAGEGDGVAQAERAALFYQDLFTTDKLPQGVREKAAMEYIGALINADQREVVEKLREGGMLDAFSFEDRKAIDSAMRDSVNRTEAMDGLGVVEANGQYEADVAAGNATPESLTAYIQTETAAGRMTYDQGKSLRMKFAKGLSNKDDTLAVMRAVGNHDLTTLASLGFTGQEGLEQMDKQLAAQGVPLDRRMQVGMQHGLAMGTLPKSVGETIGQAVRAVGSADPREPVNGDLVNSLNTMVSTLTIAEQKNPGARGVLLESMPKDAQGPMAYVLSQQEKGVSPVDALKEYATNREAFAKLDVLEQGLKTADFKKEVQSKIDSEVYSGFFGRIGNALGGNANLSSNPLFSAQMGSALQDELGQITNDRNNMGLSPEAALDLAVSRVQSRTVEVGEAGWLGTGEKRRSLIIPRGVELQTVFGSSDKQAIGRTLSQLYPKTASEFESTFRYNRATGVLENVQVADNGQVVGRPVPVDTQAIGRGIRTEQERQLTAAQEALFGASVDVSGTPFKMDGGNTYGIPVRTAYSFRKDLAGFEAYRDTVYKDANGLAVGIGHNVTGQMKEGDTISKAQAEKWFREDTDTAMQTGSTLARELGVRDGKAVAGLAGAAFQLGAEGLRKHTKTAEAIRNLDFATFVNEVRSSDWHKQTPNRTEWFIKQMAPHFAR